jgi:serine/threonine-protein kinase
MTDDKYGPSSYAATAIADAPGTRPRSGDQEREGGASSGVESVSGLDAGTQGGERADLLGRTVHGRYLVRRLIGAGGMGGVYEAEHIEIGKRVALKLVHALHARDPQIAARIKQEARSIGAIESENIVQIFDAGEDPELGIFLVMELLKGEDLGALLARRGTISPFAAATIVSQAALGLSRAHAAGIVHRDLKPANVFLSCREGGGTLVKLVDFGIAKLIRDANEARRQGAGITRMGMVIGTPQYMSPEQAQGFLTVDHRTDVYSLGAVLFEAIAGHSPFRELPTYEQTILQIVTGTAPRLGKVAPDVPAELDELCADMLAHDPDARPPNVLVVRERIGRIFPELDGGRMPMRSSAGDTLDSPPISVVDATKLEWGSISTRTAGPLSGVSAAGPRLSAPIPPQSARALLEGTHDAHESVFRRYGVHVAVTAAIAAVIGVALAGASKRAGGSSAAVGLVQPSAVVPAVTATVTPPQAESSDRSHAGDSTPVAAASASPTSSPPAPIASSPVKVPARDHLHVGNAHRNEAKPASHTVGRSVASPEASSKEQQPPERLVGGTTESKEF